MFQRLKGAIDSRIAEEQARQRAAQVSSSSPSRSSAAPRQARAPTASPSGRQRRAREAVQLDDKGTPIKGPDPAEFEKEVVEDAEDVSDRVEAAPPPNEKSDDAGENSKQNEGEPLAGEDALTKQGSGESVSVDLATDVRVRLRKLGKLEGKYSELLRAYRVAHGRVTLIDNFETSLREHTPLTSINDPAAFVEYLNQMQLRSDMVLEELKRLTKERDELKQQAVAAHKSSTEAWEEVSRMRAERKDHQRNEASSGGDTQSGPAAGPVDAVKSPSTDDQAQASKGSLVSDGLLKNAEDATEPDQSGEALFSYDDELPRLNSELQMREVRVEESEAEIQSLRSELAAARESTEKMVQSFESATEEVQSLKDEREQDRTNFEAHRVALEKNTRALQQQVTSAEMELQSLKDKYEEQKEAMAQSHDVKDQVDSLLAERAELQSSIAEHTKRVRTLNSLVDSLRSQLDESETVRGRLNDELEVRRHAAKYASPRTTSNDETTTLAESGKHGDPGQAPALVPKDNEQILLGYASGAGSQSKKKKKPKKKKPGEKPGIDISGVNGQPESSGPNNHNAEADTGQPVNTAQARSGIGSPGISELHEELSKLQDLLQERNAEIERLKKRRKTEEDLQDEIDSLREDLVNVGQDSVDSKERVKQLEAEREDMKKRQATLEEQISHMESDASSSADSKAALDELTKSFEELKRTSAALQTDLSAAQHLAASRYKDLTTLKETLHKAQPELSTLRSEVAALKSVEEQLQSKSIEMTKLETRDKESRSEILALKKQLSEAEGEVRRLSSNIKQEKEGREKAEASLRTIEGDLSVSEAEKRKLSETRNANSREILKLQEELNNYKSKLQASWEQTRKLEKDLENLKEEIELKTAQHASAQSLMASMRDQTSEMGMQTKEARERCENLEEELGDAHRLLSERSRESETMRRLLADVESRAETRVREMRMQVENAVEERDRAEEEASTVGRKRAREVDELKTKTRTAEKDLQAAEADREELRRAQKDWRSTREELEAQIERAVGEINDVRRAMSELRDALDQSEQQARELERQKGDLRRTLEERQVQLEKMQTVQKALSDEVRSLKTSKTRPTGSEAPSSRTSFESNSGGRRVFSPSAGGGVGGGNENGNGKQHRRPSSNGISDSPSHNIDYVYLKNVLLQFLEQKDKKYQMQLIPVLGTLLHFDGKDEQKWMTAITAR